MLKVCSCTRQLHELRYVKRSASAYRLPSTCSAVLFSFVSLLERMSALKDTEHSYTVKKYDARTVRRRRTVQVCDND